MAIGRSEWIAEVDLLLRETYSIGCADAGWDEEDADRYYSYGMDPREFVLWFGEKRDLIVHEPSRNT